MTWRGLIVVIAVSGASILSAGVRAQREPNFEGMWRTAQPTGGVAAARIFRQGGGLKVQLWGACKPVDCDWGVTAFSQLPDAESTLPDRGVGAYSGRYTMFRLDGADLVIELYGVPVSGGTARSYFGITRLSREK